MCFACRRGGVICGLSVDLCLSLLTFPVPPYGESRDMCLPQFVVLILLLSDATNLPMTKAFFSLLILLIVQCETGHGSVFIRQPNAVDLKLADLRGLKEAGKRATVAKTPPDLLWPMY